MEQFQRFLQVTLSQGLQFFGVWWMCAILLAYALLTFLAVPWLMVERLDAGRTKEGYALLGLNYLLLFLLFFSLSL